MRAFLLERGITVPVGRTVFARRIGEILEDAENGVSVRMRGLLHRLRQRWLLLDNDIKQLTDDLGRLAGDSDFAVEPVRCQASVRSSPLR